MPSYGVCLSVTFAYSDETSKLVFIFFTMGSHTVLVFTHQTLWQYSDGDTITVAKIAIFDQYLALGSMTD